MLKFDSNKKKAVIENDQAVIKIEDTLRACHIDVDLIIGIIRVVFYRGHYKSDLSFEITDPKPIMVEIKDEPARQETRPKLISGEQQMVLTELPERKLFSQLITPKNKEKWFGDFKIKDIEQVILDNNLLPEFTFTEIVDQK